MISWILAFKYVFYIIKNELINLKKRRQFIEELIRMILFAMAIIEDDNHLADGYWVSVLRREGKKIFGRNETDPKYLIAYNTYIGSVQEKAQEIFGRELLDEEIVAML